jgi:hypothetical protein
MVPLTCVSAVLHNQRTSPTLAQLDLHLLCRMHAESTSQQGTFALSDITVMPHFTSAPALNSSHAGTAAAAQHLALHIGETTIQLPFSPAQAQQLDAELAKLLQTFSDKQAAKRPKR